MARAAAPRAARDRGVRGFGEVRWIWAEAAAGGVETWTGRLSRMWFSEDGESIGVSGTLF